MANELAHVLHDDGERVRCSCGWASLPGADRLTDLHLPESARSKDWDQHRDECADMTQDPLNDLERKQMDACIVLAKALAAQRIKVMVLYELGDAPSVQTDIMLGIEVCADGSGHYDVWTTSSPLATIKQGLTLDQAFAVLASRR